jgi:hypothetical protein
VPRVPATVPPDPRARFAALAAQPEPDLAEAALWLAAEEYPALDVQAYLARIDELAAEARPALAGAMTGAARGARRNPVRFGECGGRGNPEG